ncbi:hypothetical protein ACN9MZ_16405 [Pseudoduganella sp. S-14]|uniref:hypothetical protein n=1 Tax=Pseudoduganella sp. S-14 TaxID=3404065 RepID=UPI003CEF7EC7
MARWQVPVQASKAAPHLSKHDSGFGGSLEKVKVGDNAPDGTPRNGETATVKNVLTMNKDLVPAESRYLGVHIYPDDSAELTFSKYIPERTSRGESILAEVLKNAR